MKEDGSASVPAADLFDCQLEGSRESREAALGGEAEAQTFAVGSKSKQTARQPRPTRGKPKPAAKRKARARKSSEKNEAVTPANQQTQMAAAAAGGGEGENAGADAQEAGLPAEIKAPTDVGFSSRSAPPPLKPAQPNATGRAATRSSRGRQPRKEIVGDVVERHLQ
eukprot:GHVT01070435.1.p1 GENE.GHVT01070435.1~~GHVT01070435.1.p1  ORF type:complete len:195 (+),score=68.79 GHVT01070435.1:87-587(+)